MVSRAAFKLLLAQIVLLPLFAYAQYPDWIYLSRCNYIHSFAEEGNYIWLSDYQGLVRMDKLTGAKTYFDKTTCPIPDHSVYDIVVDHNQVKWMAVNSFGIVRFDGVNWSVFDTANSPINLMGDLPLVVDSSNNLWTSTGDWNQTGALLKYDGSNWTSYTTSNSGIPNTVIGCIYADGNIIWLQTPAGLTRFDGTNWSTFTSQNSNYSNLYAMKISKDSDGNIWLCHTDGLQKFDGNTFTLYNSVNTNFPYTVLNSFAIDTSGIIWAAAGGCIGCWGGVLSFDGSSWTQYDTTGSIISDIAVQSIFVDKSNSIWVGCKGSGFVDRFENSQWSHYNISKALLHDTRVRQIATNSSGDAFIGTGDPVFVTYGQGLATYNWNTWSSLSFYDDDSYVFNIDKYNNLYIKNSNELKKFDGTNWTNVPNAPLYHTPYSSAYAINELTTDTSGGIWMDYLTHISTDSTGQYMFFHEGVAHYDGINWTLYNNLNSPLPDASIVSLQVDSRNNVWALVYGGLAKFDGTNWVIYTTGNSCLPFSQFSSFAIDTLDNIWFSEFGVGYYKFDGVNCTFYPDMRATSMYNMAIDTDGSLWGISGCSLQRFDGTNTIEFDHSNSPLPYGCNIYSLSIDSYGNKWIGTNVSVFVYRSNGVILNSPYLSKETPSSDFIFPNLSTDNIFVRCPSNSLIKIYNPEGKMIKEVSVSDSGKPIDISNLSNGIYIVKVYSGKSLLVGKIIKL
ncbi:MAG: T9SS type A sorting domain-containing protein [Bacteroidia bacterium]|nr:T9SS type A sorting domain-containing protein [Bacteroidia bacterium]